MKLALGTRIIEGSPVSVEEFIDLVAAIGYQGIDLRGTTLPADREKIKNLARYIREKGLEVSYLVGEAVNDEESFDKFKRYVAWARELGTELLLVTPLNPEWGIKCSDYLEREGLNLRLFSQMHTGPLFSTFDQVLKTLAEIDRDNFGISLDPGNLLLLNQDYSYENLQKIADHLFAVHFQNIKVYAPDSSFPGEIMEHQGKKFQRCLPGDPEGADLDKFFGNLKKIKYDGWITIIEPLSKVLSLAETAKIGYERLKIHL